LIAHNSFKNHRTAIKKPDSWS